MWLDILAVYACVMLLIGTLTFYALHLQHARLDGEPDPFRMDYDEWRRTFEPNRANVAEYPAYAEDDQAVDHVYLRELRLSQSSLLLPDDHLPHDWRDWGDKTGAAK